MSYEYKIYHKETGEEIHEENFSQYFSQYIALDSDGDLVEIDSRDAVVVSVVDFAYIKFNKTDEYEAKVRAFDAYHSIISKHIEQQYSHNKHDMVKRFVKIHDEYESGERSE